MIKSNRFLVLSLIGFFLLAGIAEAADNFLKDLQKTPEQLRAEMSSSGLLSQAGKLLGQQNFAGAVPYLVDYLDRMSSTDDRRVRALVQNVRLKLGRILAYQNDYLSATKYLEQYLEGKPIYNPREALKMLALSYFESSEFHKSISTVTNALNSPEIVAEEVKTKRVEEFTDDELAGVTKRQLRRYREQQKEVNEELGLTEALTSDKPPAEPDYTLQEKVLLHMTLAESYSALEEWEQSVEPFQFVIENAEEEERRGFAIMKLVTSLSNLKRFDEVKELVVELAKTDARYDIRVNMAMMNAASSLFNAGQYDSALSMYRMILPRKELADHHLAKINELRGTVGLPNMIITLATNEVGRVESLVGYAYGERSDQMIDEEKMSLLRVEMPAGLMEKEASVGTLLSLPPYENDVIYRMAQLYLECGRPWEALAGFDLTAAVADDVHQKNQAFCGALQVLVDPLEMYDRVEERAIPFLDQYAEGVAPRQVAYYLTAAYQRQDLYKKVKELRPYLDGFVAEADPLARQYDCELYYMQAIADLMLLNYEAAKAGFAEVLQEYPKSHQEENLRYWHAMTHLFTMDYEGALRMLEEYLQTYPEGEWMPSCWFQSGVCQFALEEYELAKQRFTYVIDTFREDSVYPDACSMRGDIFGSEGLLDEAVRDYREAIATAQKPNQASYAVFQLSAVFEAQELYDDIITLVNDYLDRYEEKADVAKAAYWVGKTKMAQGRVEEAIDAYLDTVFRYGGDIRQDGVDLIISELMTVARELEDAELAQLKLRVKETLRTTDNVTLQLRLRVMIAELDGATIELGETLIAELDDLTKAPPPVLSVICDASFARKDYSRAQDILTIFQTYFEDSEFMRAAYKLRVYDLFSQGFSGVAMEVVMDAQDLYGAETDTAWIQLMKGRLEMEMGNLDVARETFRSILQVRFWRGEPYAEATYCLGQLEEKAGDLKTAFGWYQRTYFLYKGLAGGYWAAEGYLASARCLKALGLDVEMRNTYRAMLYDKYVNTLPQADVARTALGEAEVLEIQQNIASGLETNLVITVESEESK